MKGIKVKKVVLAVCLAMLTMSLIVGCFGGCKNSNNTTTYEDRAVGDFNVRFYADYCEIIGTTDQGNDKKFLVIPEYIEGIRVESLGLYQPLMLMDSAKIISPEMKSDKLEKIYFESAIKVSHYTFAGKNDGFDCPNLAKVMYPSRQISPYKIVKRGLVYYPRKVYEDMCGSVDLPNVIDREIYPANVSYYCNYENAESDYYWNDDCDYNEKIEYVPKNPTRDGYVFSGWYKEADCINEWDFDTDTLPEKVTEMREVIVDGNLELTEVTMYQETAIYAKWTKQG